MSRTGVGECGPDNATGGPEGRRVSQGKPGENRCLRFSLSGTGRRVSGGPKGGVSVSDSGGCRVSGLVGSASSGQWRVAEGQ